MGKDIKLQKIGDVKNVISIKMDEVRVGKKIKLEKIFNAKKIENKKNKIKMGVAQAIKVDLLPIGEEEIKQQNKKTTKQKSIKTKIIKKENSKKKIIIKNKELGIKRKEKKTEVNEIKKKSWIVLDEKTGANFVLGNLKERGDSLNFNASIKGEQNERNVIGMPEAGRKEPWNLIKIKEPYVEKKEEEYILDDFDVLRDTLNYEIKQEKYIASPFVVNLGNKQEKIEQEIENNKLKIENSRFLSKFGYIKRRLDCWRNSMSEIMAGKGGYLSLSLFGLRKKDFGGKHKVSNNNKKEFLRKFKNAFSIKHQVLATVANFSIIALFLILPIYSIKYLVKARGIKGKVLGATTQALQDLKIGKDLLGEATTGLGLQGTTENYTLTNNSFKEANNKFDEAKLGFEIAEEALNGINNTASNLALKVFNKDEEVNSARALIKAGEKASEISKLISEGMSNIEIKKLRNKEVVELGNLATRKESVNEASEDIFEGETSNPKLVGSLMDIIKQFNNTAEEVIPKIKELKSYLAEVDLDAVPSEYKEEIKGVMEMTEYIQYRMTDCVKYSKTITSILAGGTSKRYLLVFQNNNELRATGGFIGSYSLLDIKNGEIVNFETSNQGSYALQGGLLSNIEPPNALQLINGRWEFQDSNWWPDFPQSSKFISDIYEKSGGPTVDGVIAINGQFMKNLLEVIGEVEMPAYGKIINADNFISETQKIAELEYDRGENNPKQIITDLMPLVIERMFDLENGNFIDMLSVFSNGLRKRDIQIYSNDSFLEKEIKDLGWGGEIKNIENRDYLAVIDTNLGGRKTDGVIAQHFKHNTEVLVDGTIIDELVITKKHNGVKGDYFEGVNNVDYLRIYAPLGSVLLEAEGFDPPPEDCYKKLRENIIKDSYLAYVENKEKVDIETGTIIGENFGKTYFANWTQVDPGEVITIRIKYRLPFKLFDSPIHPQPLFREEKIGKYSLYIQKQSGSNSHTITKNINLPDNLKTAWSYPGAPENGEWIAFDKLDGDRFYGGIFVGEQ